MDRRVVAVSCRLNDNQIKIWPNIVVHYKLTHREGSLCMIQMVQPCSKPYNKGKSPSQAHPVRLAALRENHDRALRAHLAPALEVNAMKVPALVQARVQKSVEVRWPSKASFI